MEEAMKPLMPVVALLALAACAPKPATEAPTAPAAAAPKPVSLPAGDYRLDKSHASLVFKVSHLGFSNYTAAFSDFDAKLTLDPANPGAATLEATVDPRSLTLPSPPAGFKDELTGPQWLNAGQHPRITFKSTKVEVTGVDTAKVTGDFSLLGVTKPLTLTVKFNGGYPGHPMDPNARIGFSGEGVLKRSDYGLTYGIPAPGTTMGVGDAVTVQIEAEFTGPPLPKTPV
jgi:polyisoprenoid-binding protein YceI